MATPTTTLTDVLQCLADSLQGGRFRALMIGGFALPAYGVERLTLDVDFMVTEEDVAPLAMALKSVGYTLAFRSPQFARLRAAASALPDIDLVFVDPAVMDAVWADRVLHLWAGVELPVASLAVMLGTKLHALRYNREARSHKSDLGDLRGLLEANGIDPTGDWFRQLCEKYGTRELWETLCKPDALPG
jgi:hypothetical protein